MTWVALRKKTEGGRDARMRAAGHSPTRPASGPLRSPPQVTHSGARAHLISHCRICETLASQRLSARSVPACAAQCAPDALRRHRAVRPGGTQEAPRGHPAAPPTGGFGGRCSIETPSENCPETGAHPSATPGPLPGPPLERSRSLQEPRVGWGGATGLPGYPLSAPQKRIQRLLGVRCRQGETYPVAGST